MEAKIPMKEVVGGITCNIVLTGYRAWKIRARLAVLLIRFAIRITGMRVNIEYE